nr:uncharacterized protein LOC126525120 [Dermacentor andersoni]
MEKQTHEWNGSFDAVDCVRPELKYRPSLSVKMRATVPVLLLCMATLAVSEEEQRPRLVLVTERTHEQCFPIRFLGLFVCVEWSNIDMFVPSGNHTGPDPNSTSDSSSPPLDTTSDGDSESPTAADESTPVEDSSAEITASDTQDISDSGESSPSESGAEGSD